MGTTFERDGRGATVDPEVRSEEFEAYYREHQPSLLRYAMSRNAVDPEGVVHLALLDGFGALDRMRSREPRSIRAYLFRAVTSHIAMEHRRLGSEQFGSHESVEVDGFEDRVLSRLEFDRALDLLPRDQRAVIKLRFFDDLSAEEAGRILGKTAAAVRQLQLRGIRRLRRLGFTAVVLLVLLGAVALVWRWTAPQRSLVQPAEQPETTVEEESAPDLLGDQESVSTDEQALSLDTDGGVTTNPLVDVRPENAEASSVSDSDVDLNSGLVSDVDLSDVAGVLVDPVSSPPTVAASTRSSSAPAQVYEGFDLSITGADVTDNPSVASFGFADVTTWAITRGDATATHDPVGLSYVDSNGQTLLTNPGAVTVKATEEGTHLSRPLAESPGDSYWVAFLLRPNTDGYGDAFWSPDGYLDRGGVGIQQFHQLRYVNGGATNTAFVAGETYLLVVRFEGKQSSLWVNPNLSDPGTPDATYSDERISVPDRLYLITNEFNDGAYTFDEIRLGASFEAVTPLS
jgi:RNA polymerase sigma-70 factor (ECF subfamily)